MYLAVLCCSLGAELSINIVEYWQIALFADRCLNSASAQLHSEGKFSPSAPPFLNLTSAGGEGRVQIGRDKSSGCLQKAEQAPCCQISQYAVAAAPLPSSFTLEMWSLNGLSLLITSSNSFVHHGPQIINFTILLVLSVSTSCPPVKQLKPSAPFYFSI